MFKNLFAIVALVAFTLFINPGSAQAAVSDCASQGCVAVCNNAGVEMYFNDGTHAGTISGVGTGGCYIDADEGYLIINRTDGTTYIYNVENGTQCSFTYAGQNSLVFGSHVYVASGANHRIARVGLDCSGYTEISVPGTYPWGMTKDSTTIYVMNSQTANITTIVPPSTTPVYHDIGRVFGDQLTAVQYHAGNNKLYAGGLNAIYEIPLPLDGTSALWQTISTGVDEMSLTSTHIGVSSNAGNSAHLIPVASPSSYMTMGCQSCRSVALNDSTFYSMGGTSPDLNVRTWDMSGSQYGYSPLSGGDSAAWLAPTVTPPSCPNGTKEGTEECDGTDFGTATCQTLGFDGGSLSCTGTCTISTTGCTMNCGNGSIESPEECDGINLNGQDCTDLGFDSGTLSCSASCEFVTTQCVTLTCGNSQIDSGEDCDGANLNGASCTSLGLGFTGGTLSCSPTSCEFDTSACTVDLCGNGTIDNGEDCDGINLGGETCQSQGFDGGSLSCSGSCEFNTTACTLNTCGNGVIDNGEECDDDNTNAGDGCGGNCQIEDGYACEGQPSTCTLIEEPCNQDGLVEVLDSISHPDLQGAALEQYQISSALPKGSTITCETAFGVDVIKVQVPAGHHANIRIVTSTMEVVWHLYDGATLLVPVENPSLMNRIGGGDIFLHSGSDIEAKYESLGLGTLGTAGMNRFFSAHPLTGASGNWLEVRVTTDRIRLFALEDAGNTVTLVATEMDAPIYVNLDALGDLSKIFQPPTKKDPGCGCSVSGNGSSSLPIALVIVLIFSVIRRRKVSGSR